MAGDLDDSNPPLEAGEGGLQKFINSANGYVDYLVPDNLVSISITPPNPHVIPPHPTELDSQSFKEYKEEIGKTVDLSTALLQADAELEYNYIKHPVQEVVNSFVEWGRESWIMPDFLLPDAVYDCQPEVMIVPNSTPLTEEQRTRIQNALDAKNK